MTQSFVNLRRERRNWTLNTKMSLFDIFFFGIQILFKFHRLRNWIHPQDFVAIHSNLNFFFRILFFLQFLMVWTIEGANPLKQKSMIFFFFF
jgi:hypothetical protein